MRQFPVCAVIDTIVTHLLLVHTHIFPASTPKIIYVPTTRKNKE
jgi:hypothetical protein